MFKRIISILLFSTFLLTGCAKSNSDNGETTTKSKGQQEQTKESTEISLNTTQTPTTTKTGTLSLNNEDISYTEFLQTESQLFFIDENNKISVIEDSIDTPYITKEQIAETFDYSTDSLAAINNEVFFSNMLDNNALYKLNYDKKEFTKMYSGNFHNISSYKNNIVFINGNAGSSLSYFDIKNSQLVALSSDKCGKYIINGDYIIYQNLSDNSSLYSIKIDGSEKTKLIASPVDSFLTYENNILNISAESNDLYIYDPTNKTNKRIDSIHGTSLKSYDNKLFYISLSNSNHLHSLEIGSDLTTATNSELTKDMINDYFPTENGIFLREPIDINKVYFLQYE